MRTPAQALIEGPIAIPPLPLPDSQKPAGQVTARQHRVAANGNIRITRSAVVHLDTEHVSTQVTVINSGQNINIFDAHGTHIRSLNLIPGRTYYGNGKPRGPRPKPKCPD